MHGKVSSNAVVVFSKSYCPYSTMAKDALLGLLQPQQVLVVEVDQLQQRPVHDGGGIEADTLMDALAQATGHAHGAARLHRQQVCPAAATTRRGSRPAASCAGCWPRRGCCCSSRSSSRRRPRQQLARLQAMTTRML
ncbi:hypothetical protein COO60DRAFT_1511017, partial [Scenedesmus sp. NREL 46B-D3]